MRTQTRPVDSPAAMAHVLAMVMASHPKDDPRELRLLEGLNAFKRIGVSEAAFLRIAPAGFGVALARRLRITPGCTTTTSK